MSKSENELARVYQRDEQERVTFHGHSIIAVRLDDGRIAVTIQSLAEGMGLNTQAQVRRAERTEALEGEIAYPWLETEQGAQEMPALVLDVLPGWLMGVDTRRIKGETHDTILAYQREAYSVLYRHFADRSHPALPVTSAVVSPNMPAPVDPQQVMALTEQIDTLTGVVNLLQEHLANLLVLPGQVADMSTQVDQAIRLLESLAERQDTAEVQLARIDERTQRLTPAHARAAQEMVDRLVRETRHLPTPLTYATIYGRLKHRFRAGSYKEIADNRFDELMDSLRDELSQATSGKAAEQAPLF